MGGTAAGGAFPGVDSATCSGWRHHRGAVWHLCRHADRRRGDGAGCHCTGNHRYHHNAAKPNGWLFADWGGHAGWRHWPADGTNFGVLVCDGNPRNGAWGGTHFSPAIKQWHGLKVTGRKKDEVFL